MATTTLPISLHPGYGDGLFVPEGPMAEASLMQSAGAAEMVGDHEYIEPVDVDGVFQVLWNFIT